MNAALPILKERPFLFSAAIFGVGISPPKLPMSEKPTSSSRITTTFGRVGCGRVGSSAALAADGNIPTASAAAQLARANRRTAYLIGTGFSPSLAHSRYNLYIIYILTLFGALVNVSCKALTRRCEGRREASGSLDGATASLATPSFFPTPQGQKCLIGTLGEDI